MLHGFVFSGSGKSAVGFGPSRDKSHFSVGQRLASAWDLIFYTRSCHFIPIAALAARSWQGKLREEIRVARRWALHFFLKEYCTFACICYTILPYTSLCFSSNQHYLKGLRFTCTTCSRCHVRIFSCHVLSLKEVQRVFSLPASRREAG